MITEKSDLENDNPALNKPNVGRSFTNVFVEIDGKPIPIRELPKIEYEAFLEGMHRLRLAYIAVVGRWKLRPTWKYAQKPKRAIF